MPPAFKGEPPVPFYGDTKTRWTTDPPYFNFDMYGSERWPLECDSFDPLRDEAHFDRKIRKGMEGRPFSPD
ncbi:hypothetical protein TNIN_69371 [Trichonephila inaurata madagascariensis]|uniref:Uncharacterized protein n=1 Tax=Trichonephila inaurata madagascariensis TaxID=2747483 RepID=A0A8X7CEY9_9ARAC|nr:hypothetical protein TNIN_69371 [Trichonephila inaurata madagascariensis]